MKFHTDNLHPWADFLRILQNARSLVVKVGSFEYRGEFELSIDDDGQVTMAFGQSEEDMVPMGETVEHQEET